MTDLATHILAGLFGCLIMLVVMNFLDERYRRKP